MPETKTGRPIILLSDVHKRFDLLAFDFQRHLGLDLADELPRRTYRWLRGHISGLLVTETTVPGIRGIATIPATLIGGHFAARDMEE